jgi:hypothetical protein
MKERALTLALALAALVAFAVIVFGGRQSGPSARDGRPVSAERAPNGYAALRGWLEASGVRVASFRRRFETLAAPSARRPATGNLLVVTLPGVQPVGSDELPALDAWLRTGNTLLIAAALADAPEWADASGADTFDLKALTGLDFERDAVLPAATHRPRRLLVQPLVVEAGPQLHGGLLEGIGRLQGICDFEPQRWRLRIPYDGFALELARSAGTGGGVLWTRRVGRGLIVVSAYGSLLTNREIGRADNGRLFANLVARSVGEGGAVLFDDGHQGLAPGYSPQAFFADPRLYWSAAVLALLWLVWLIGGTRLRVPGGAGGARVPALEDLVAAHGGLLARVLAPSAAARALCENFFARLLARRGVAAGAAGSAPPWDLLERDARVAPAELGQLRRWHARALLRRRVPLVRLHNLIESLDRQTA